MTSKKSEALKNTSTIRQSIHEWLFENGPTKVSIIGENFPNLHPKHRSNAFTYLKEAGKIMRNKGGFYEALVSPYSEGDKIENQNIEPVDEQIITNVSDKSLTDTIAELEFKAFKYDALISDLQHLIDNQ